MKKVIALATIAAFALSAASASAFYWNSSSSDIDASNTNWAYVSNNVNTSANTGGNTTEGGSANGSKANGGDATVVTGDALAASSVLNQVNSNTTKITKDCGCKGDITVTNDSGAKVKNTVNTDANTGYNTTNGGDASASKTYRHYRHHNSGGSANGGDAVVITGNAGSLSEVVNVVNSNLTRIK